MHPLASLVKVCIMAAPVTSDSDLSDIEPIQSDVNSSDFSEFDVSLLDDAKEVMERISPRKQPIPTKLRKVKAKKHNDNQKTTKTTKTKSKKVSKKLSKSEIDSIVQMLRENKVSIVKEAETIICNEAFWHAHQNYHQCLLQCFKAAGVKDIIDMIFEDYITIYLSCDKGNTKFDDFQLLWFQNYSKYFSKATGEIKQLAESVNIFLLEDYMDSCSVKHFYSCLISSFHQAIFDVCCRKTMTFFEPDKQVGSSSKVEHEDHSLLRIHGWVLKEVIDHPQKQNTGLSDTEKAEWSKCSQQLRLNDKSDIYQELKHLDREHGQGLTFPTICLQPFMQQCDLLYKESSCEENFLKFGKNIAEVTKVQVKSNVELAKMFEDIVLKELGQNTSKSMVQKIYTLWIEKFLNVRIKDTFLEAKEKLDLKASNKITAKTQNLRCGLLTHHVGNKSAL